MKKEDVTELKSRREFLWRSALVGAVVYSGGSVVGNTQAQSTRINVRDPPYNAQGDGVTNDTPAFRNAIDDLPINGTLVVPAGTYMLNANPTWCVSLKSDMKVELQADAKLKAIPSSLERHYLLWIDGLQNVDIYGLGTGVHMAEIIGERDQHMGTTGEWGQGIRIVGSANITVENVRISKFWGDGITVARKDGNNSSNVSILGVICTDNRRQGMSIIGVSGMEVSDSEFTNTEGTAPQSGIDIEPDSGGSVSGVLIRRCVLSQNAGNGLEINALAGEGFVVSDLEVRNCDIADNYGYGVFANHARGSWLVLNRIRESGLKGIRIAAQCMDLAIGQNTFTNNSLRTFTNPDPLPPCAVVTGLVADCTGRHVEVVAGAMAINVNENTYCHRDIPCA